MSILVNVGASCNLPISQTPSSIPLNSSDTGHFEKSIYAHLERSPLFLLEFCDEITESSDTEENDDQYGPKADFPKVDLGKILNFPFFNSTVRHLYSAKIYSNPLYILFQVYRI